MNKRIVTESPAYIRKLSRDSLRGKWMQASVAAFIFYVLTVFVRNVLNLMVDNSINITGIDGRIVSLTISGNLYDFLTTPIFTYGFFVMVLLIVREGKVQIDKLFSGFEFYLKLLLITIVIGIKIILWLCLFVIPGIVAAFNYSQTYFIFFDDPSKGVFECINESKRLMQGNKGNLFILCLSYFGWLFLAALATNVILIPLPILPFGDYFTQIYSMIAYIPLAIVMAYFYTAHAHFYELLKPIVVEDLTKDAYY